MERRPAGGRLNLPDLRRARGLWLTNPRLILGALGVTGACAVAALNANGYKPGESLLTTVLLVQHAALFFYGVPALVNDLLEEQQKNTWDMLRLTPLRPWEVVLGRALSATSYALFLAAVAVPWGFIAQTMKGTEGLADFAFKQGWMTLTFAATCMTGVAAAALAARHQAGRMGIAGIGMGGIGFLVSFYAVMDARGPGVVHMFGTQVPGAFWLMACGAAWLFWASVAANRLIGALMSERFARWALPGFVATLWAYFSVLQPGPGATGLAYATMSVTVPGVAVLLAALGEVEGQDDWAARAKALERGRPTGALLPDWALGWATLAALSAVTAAVSPGKARVAAAIPAFIARDLFLLSWLRLNIRRNAEVTASVLIGMLYLLPLFFGTVTNSAESLYWILPVETPAVGFLSNWFPGLAQAAAAAALFSTSLRRLRRSPPS